MELKICFRDIYKKPGIKDIVENVCGNISSKITNHKSIETICRAIDITNKREIKSLSMVDWRGKTISNSAQKSYVNFVKKLCEDDVNFEKLKKEGWLYPREQSSDPKKRYEEIRDGLCIYKDAELTVLMLRAIRILLDIKKENLLDKYYFILDIKREESSIKEPEGLDCNSVLKRVADYIRYKGFDYDLLSIKNFYLCLKSKPFVILAGISGTGKTKLIKLFAEAIEAEYKLVSVRPDWSDSSDLIGHTNMKGEFVSGAVIDYIQDAIDNSNKPYFLCLDEMNLARVEYYFSDFLSIIETRRREGKHIISDNICLGSEGESRYSDLYLPENLYFIGTVNMDETTFPFSKKVLDRANTIEFSEVNLVPKFDDADIPSDNLEESALLQNVSNNFLKSKYITLLTDIEISDREYVKNVCIELQNINKILQKANAHIGYRTRDEISFYMLNNRDLALLEYNEAMDFEIMQKILPRIQGSSSDIKDLLIELFKFFAGDYSSFSQDLIWQQMDSCLSSKQPKYPKSAEKICYMMRRFEEDGFTSYWL